MKFFAKIRKTFVIRKYFIKTFVKNNFFNKQNNMKKQKTTKTDRLKDVVEWLKSEKIIKNRRHLMELIGYRSESQFSSMMNGTKPVPERFLVNLANLDNRLNVEWLRAGNGEMLKDTRTVVKQTIKGSVAVGGDVSGKISQKNLSVPDDMETNNLLLEMLAKQQEQMDKLINAIINLKK